MADKCTDCGREPFVMIGGRCIACETERAQRYLEERQQAIGDMQADAADAIRKLFVEANGLPPGARLTGPAGTLAALAEELGNETLLDELRDFDLEEVVEVSNGRVVR